MRFTLQHVLVWQASCLAVIAGNVAIGGRCDLAQGTMTVGVCGAGCALGILVHGRIWRGKLASIWPALIGEGFLLGLVLLVNLSHTPQPLVIERCTRTLCVKKSWPLGVLNPTWIEYGEEAKFVRDVLKYVPGEHHWVSNSHRLQVSGGPGPRSEYSWPQSEYPMLELTLEDLKKLALLEPVEKSHVVFEWENLLDDKLALAREAIIQDLRHRFSEAGRKRWKGSDEAIAQWWWRENEPLLKPIKLEVEFHGAVRQWNDAHSKWGENNQSVDAYPALAKVMAPIVWEEYGGFPK